MNKVGTLLGILVLAVSIAAAPIPLAVIIQNPTRNVVIYPNLLFAVPLLLLGALLLLYGATDEKEESQSKSDPAGMP